MSSFKKLSKSDVTVVPYNANKQWTLSYCPYPTSSDYLTIYKGTNVTGSFSLDEDVTENQYERLVYTQINQLFYQDYTASLDTSSLMFTLNNYESASQQRPTSSYFVYNDNKNLVNYFPTGAMEGIRILAVNQEIYGNKVLPNHFILSSSAYYITDDGYGNLYDGLTHIGNMFYAHGLGVITNQDYQLMFPLPPLAKNDIVYFQDTDSPKAISPLNNDDARGGTLVPSTLTLSGSATDLAFWTNNGDGTVTLNSSVVGTYVIYYTVETSYSCGNIPSNKAKIVASVGTTPPPPTTTTTSTTTTTTTPPPTTTTTTSTTTTTTTPPPTTTTTTTTTTTSTTTTTTTAPPTTTTTSTTTTTTTEPPITLSIAYIDVSGNIRLDANSLTSLTEDIEFQVIRSVSHAYTSNDCTSGEISNSNFFVTQTATITSGNTSGQSVDIFSTGTVQTTKIDSTTILWSDLSTTAVPNNNTTVTSPVTGKNYLVTNIDTCTPI